MADFTSHSPTNNPWRLGGLAWRDLPSRIWKEMQQDDIFGRAAQLAFYLLLALFPALLFMTALLGVMPIPLVVPEMLQSLREVLPVEGLALMEKVLGEIVKGSSAGILSLGFLGALWASSSGLTAVIETLNAAYDVEETRPFWKVRLLAITLTVGLAGFIIVSTVLVLAGEYIAQWVADYLGLGEVFRLAWVVFQWPLVMALMLFAAAVIYYVSPNVEQDWRWVTPGALFTVIVWLLVSLGFKLYAEHFGSYNAAYGSIAGVIVLMMWFYLSGAVLLIGGEINSEIARTADRQAARSVIKKGQSGTRRRRVSA